MSASRRKARRVARRLEKVTAAAESSAAQLRSAEAQANQVANQASYTTLVSDSDGIVMTTLAEPGQVVSAGQPVVVWPRMARVKPPSIFPKAHWSDPQSCRHGAPLPQSAGSGRRDLARNSGVADPSPAPTKPATSSKVISRCSRWGPPVTVRVAQGEVAAPTAYGDSVGKLD